MATTVDADAPDGGSEGGRTQAGFAAEAALVAARLWSVDGVGAGTFEGTGKHEIKIATGAKTVTANGGVTWVYFKKPFPGGLLAVTFSDQFGGLKLWTSSKAGFAFSGGTGAFTMHYIAFGW